MISGVNYRRAQKQRSERIFLDTELEQYKDWELLDICIII